MTEATAQRWAGLGYQQVPGLANRLIARYLRGQRKNMLRFFTERGFLDLAERIRQIRASRQGMLAKNRMFQKVLNDYSARITPTSISVPPPGAPAEAASAAETISADLGVLREESSGAESPLRDRGNAGDGVSGLGGRDGASGIVIAE